MMTLHRNLARIHMMVVGDMSERRHAGAMRDGKEWKTRAHTLRRSKGSDKVRASESLGDACVWARWRMSCRVTDGERLASAIFSFTLCAAVSRGSEELTGVIRLRFEEGVVSSSSPAFLLDARFLVPGFLSGPLRLGAASYSHELDLRTQLLHMGLVESHRILRKRLDDTGPNTVSIPL